MPVNESDGGGNVSITAGLVLNELRMHLLYCVCVCVCMCVYVCVCACSQKPRHG